MTFLIHCRMFSTASPNIPRFEKIMRNSKYFFILFLFLVIGYTSCAPKVAVDGVVRRDRNVILRAEYIDLGVINAFEVIRRLRPQWLRNRGIPVLPVVYVNDIQDTFDILAILHLPDIIKLEYLDAFQATGRFGTGHGNGAILVFTR